MPQHLSLELENGSAVRVHSLLALFLLPFFWPLPPLFLAVVRIVRSLVSIVSASRFSSFPFALFRVFNAPLHVYV